MPSGGNCLSEQHKANVSGSQRFLFVSHVAKYCTKYSQFADQISRWTIQNQYNIHKYVCLKILLWKYYEQNDSVVATDQI